MEKLIEVEIKGQTYTLVSKRSLIVRLKKHIPNIDKIRDLEEDRDIELAVAIYDNMDWIFFEMLTIKQPEITKKESDKIFDAFYEEYEDAEESILSLIVSVFDKGIPNKQKKRLNWFK